MYNDPIVSEDFEVPQRLDTDRLRLRCLTVQDAEKDYEAVVSSEHHLRNVFDPGGSWPDGLTLEQNIMELGWHQTEFQLRTSFAYTAVSLDETRVLGCMYIYPCNKQNHDVEISMWVRQSELQTGLDDHLFGAVKKWIAESWPFQSPVYPGRDISWAEWRS